MACGIHLGILLLCLVQAEHVRSWATEGQAAQGQNGNVYVGFSQQDSGLQRLGGSYPQDQFRQASISAGSARSSSLNTQSAVSKGYKIQRPSSSYTQTLSQLAQSGSPSTRLVQHNSLSNPKWKMTSSKQVNTPRRSFGLSTDIASGSSLSKYDKDKKNNAALGRSSIRPVQQGTSRTSQYRPGSSASVQSPSRERGLFTSSSHQSAAKMPFSTAARTPVHGKTGSSPSSSLFSAGAVKIETAARAPARRVSKPATFSAPQNERSGYNPHQAVVGQPYQNKLSPATGGKAQGNYKPTSSLGSSNVWHSQSLPAPYKQNASPVNFEPRSMKMHKSQRLSSSEQIPGQVSKSSLPGYSTEKFAPTKILNIPQRFGGYAIRRLKQSAEKKGVGVQRQSYPAASYKPQSSSVHQQSKWKRVSLPQWQNKVPQEP